MTWQKKVSLVIVGILCCLKYSFASFMPAWQAFQVSLEAESTQAIWVKFNIAPEYHLYQNKIKITTLAGSSVHLGTPLLPDPSLVNAPSLGQFKVYEGKIAIQVPVTKLGNGELKVLISYQGCKNVELCYPEQQLSRSLNLLHPEANKVLSKADLESQTDQEIANQPNILLEALNSGDSTAISQWFSHGFWLVIGGFFIVGLLLAFTPCVFPLLPVLLGVIAGQNISLRRSFSLAFSYILGGAFVYAIAGVIAASLGYSLASALQSSILNIAVALLFVLFALSLFGLFDLRLPGALQNKLNFSMNKFKQKSLINAFLIGGIANLLLSPCVTGPLAGALVYISTTGNKLLGAGALFALGLGSGLPLLFIAVFGNGILPKSGQWLTIVKHFLGLLMLLMAIYMLSKVVIASDVNWLIGLWLCLCLYLLLGLKKLSKLRFGILISLSVLIIASVMNYNLSLQKNQLTTSTVNNGFINVSNLDELTQLLLQAKQRQQPVLIDFAADWCIACKEMDLKTFNDPRLKLYLKKMLLIRADISSNDATSRQLQQAYKVFAPPTVLLLNPQGDLNHATRVVGFIEANKLLPMVTNIIKN